MKKPAINHHKAHKSPQWRASVQSARGGVPLPGFCHGPAAGGAGGAGHGGTASGKRRSVRRAFPSLGESLNWTLRRYVRASSLRVWLRRQVREAGGAPVPAGRDGPLRAVGGRAGTAGETCSPAPGERPDGVSLCRDHALRYRIHRNRQMEHLTQVAASLRGGVRRGAAITPRERAAARDLASTTLSDKSCV
jgi:hypothetical protein